MNTDTSPIAALYAAFARYPLHARVAGCPCCVGDADQRRIRSRSLRALSGADLGRYAFKARPPGATPTICATSCRA